MKTFYHSGARGDIIYALPTIKVMGGGELYLGKKIHYNALETLLKSQSYITDVKLGKPTGEFIDLDKYREVYAKNPAWHLVKCHAEGQGITVNAVYPWLDIKPVVCTDVIINRTSHYHGELDYKLLKDYNNTGFIGTDVEYNEFCKEWGFSPKRIFCGEALEIAQAIAGCKLFVGNQSLCFALAEAMKKPRILEVCKELDNCRPYNTNGYTSIHKAVLDGYLGRPSHMSNWIIMDRLVEVVLSHIPGCIVEIGIGESTAVLAKWALMFRRRHYACDVSTGKWDWFAKTGLVHEMMHKYHCKSFKFMKHFKDTPAIAFIDGNHSYAVVSKEAEFFLERLAPGGMAFFHDMYIPDKIFKKYLKKTREYDTYKCRQDIEKRSDVYSMSFPYTAARAGLTVILKKEKNLSFHKL